MSASSKRTSTGGTLGIGPAPEPHPARPCRSPNIPSAIEPSPSRPDRYQRMNEARIASGARSVQARRSLARDGGVIVEKDGQAVGGVELRQSLDQRGIVGSSGAVRIGYFS